MIISCPNCTARYEIDDEKFLPGGRSVRCSDCATSWFVPAPQGIETLLPAARISSDTNNREANAAFARSEPQGRPDRENEQARHYSRESDSPAPDDGLFAEHRSYDGAGENREINRAPAPQDQAPQVQAPQRRHQDLTGNAPDRDLDKRPKYGPMAERRTQGALPSHEQTLEETKVPRRRATDKVVDTKWEEVETRNQEARSSLSRGQARIIKNGDDDVGIEGAPGEVFASVSVQPRELERALKRVRRKAEARDKNRLTPARLVGWVGLFAMIVGCLYGVYHFREDVVRIAPVSAKVYETIGIDASPYGLQIKNIDHKVALSTTGAIVEISGELHNQSEKPIKPPLLQAEALDVHGKLLAGWTFSPDGDYVTGNGVVGFSTRAPAPEGITEVVLSFAPETSKTRDK